MNGFNYDRGYNEGHFNFFQFLISDNAAKVSSFFNYLGIVFIVLLIEILRNYLLDVLTKSFAGFTSKKYSLERSRIFINQSFVIHNAIYGS